MLRLEPLSHLATICSYLSSLRTDPHLWPMIEEIFAPEQLADGSAVPPDLSPLEQVDLPVFEHILKLFEELEGQVDLPDAKILALYARLWN